jgi:hypothetical protein
MVSGGAPRGSSATVDWGAVRGDLADLARQRKADVLVVVVVDRDALGRLQRVGVEDATVSTGSCAEAAIGESNVANPTAAATRMPVVTRLVLRMKPSSSASPCAARPSRTGIAATSYQLPNRTPLSNGHPCVAHAASRCDPAPPSAMYLRGRPKSVASQAPELRECEIGITPFDYPCDNSAACRHLVKPQGPGVLSVCPIGKVGPGGMEQDGRRPTDPSRGRRVPGEDVKQAHYR